MPGDGRFLGLFDSDGIVFIELRADAEDLARDLVEHYGDRVSVSVGRFRYPDRSPARMQSPCPEPPAASDPPLHAEAVVDAAPTAPGGWGSGVVHLRNDGADPVSFTSGTATGLLIAGGRTLGVYEGALNASGITVDLSPGGETTVPFVFGSASCEPSAGYAVPAGAYDLVIPVPGRPGLVAGPVRVTIPARGTVGTEATQAPGYDELNPAQQAALYAATIRRLATRDHGSGVGNPAPFPGILLLDHTLTEAGSPTDGPGASAPFTTGVLEALRTDLADVPLVDMIASEDAVFPPGAPPTGGPAPYRPEAVVGVSPIERAGDGYRIGAYLHLAPGSYVWAVYAVALDAGGATVTRTISQGIT
jgi:hypothetical protein